ncbi:MAG: UDP-N-acetylglucosamine 1-carboxyvinyltransferase [Candidatus Brocadiia bacterium]
MAKLTIRGGKVLNGKVRINGAKNASLPIMAATLLTEGTTVLNRVPRLRDIHTLGKILDALGLENERTDSDTIRMQVVDETNCTCPHDPAIEMRASVCILGPLLARRGKAEVPLPGGCVIGERPIDLHLKGLRALGAEIEQKNGYVFAKADKLVGNRIYMGGPRGSTVLGTANVMMAATLAEGVTTIEHAACEPEIRDLANYLTACGALIEGAGTNTLTIEGVKRLEGTLHRVIPDRIEAGTFACMAAVAGDEVVLEGARPDHMSAIMDTMENMGVKFKVHDKGITVLPPEKLIASDITALPYPGLPTDIQPQLMAALTQADGTSVVTDSVFPDRFTQVGELHRLGADIVKQGPQAVVKGPAQLTGAPVTARDLRGGASLVIAALIAEGETTIDGMAHVDRGYECIENRLATIGADVTRQGNAPFEVGQMQLPFKRAAS